MEYVSFSQGPHDIPHNVPHRAVMRVDRVATTQQAPRLQLEAVPPTGTPAPPAVQPNAPRTTLQLRMKQQAVLVQHTTTIAEQIMHAPVDAALGEHGGVDVMQVEQRGGGGGNGVGGGQQQEKPLHAVDLQPFNSDSDKTNAGDDTGDDDVVPHHDVHMRDVRDVHDDDRQPAGGAGEVAMQEAHAQHLDRLAPTPELGAGPDLGVMDSEEDVHEDGGEDVGEDVPQAGQQHGTEKAGDNQHHADDLDDAQQHSEKEDAEAAAQHHATQQHPTQPKQPPPVQPGKQQRRRRISRELQQLLNDQERMHIDVDDVDVDDTNNDAGGGGGRGGRQRRGVRQTTRAQPKGTAKRRGAGKHQQTQQQDSQQQYEDEEEQKGGGVQGMHGGGGIECSCFIVYCVSVIC